MGTATAQDLYATAAYDYELPEELIASRPCVPRDAARLMIVDRKSGSLMTAHIRDLPDILSTSDRLILNDTRVRAARLRTMRATGGRVEFLLLHQVSPFRFRAMAKPAGKLKIGELFIFEKGVKAILVDRSEDGVVELEFTVAGDINEALERIGEMPLPPYIGRSADRTRDTSDYQTVYARALGAVAAPTAGLHFTKPLLDRLAEQHITQTMVTLHVGMGTFLPVKAEDIRAHKMHRETVEITETAAQELNGSDRLVCVGTTSLRAVESAAMQGAIQAGSFATECFIYPGFEFKKTGALLTNFHLPRSTLLMLVSAFGGYDLLRGAYRKAVLENFRFYSYGDAMIIL